MACGSRSPACVRGRGRQAWRRILKDLAGSQHDLVVIGAVGDRTRPRGAIGWCANASPRGEARVPEPGEARWSSGGHRRKYRSARSSPPWNWRAPGAKQSPEPSSTSSRSRRRRFRFDGFIDTGLAPMSSSHLEVGEKMAHSECAIKRSSTSPSKVDTRARRVLVDRAGQLAWGQKFGWEAT